MTPDGIRVGGLPGQPEPPANATLACCRIQPCTWEKTFEWFESPLTAHWSGGLRVSKSLMLGSRFLRLLPNRVQGRPWLRPATAVVRSPCSGVSSSRRGGVPRLCTPCSSLELRTQKMLSKCSLKVGRNTMICKTILLTAYGKCVGPLGLHSPPGSPPLSLPCSVGTPRPPFRTFHCIPRGPLALWLPVGFGQREAQV